MRIKEFRALRPSPEIVERVASVPYDTVNTEEAKELAKGNTASFLHIVRPDIDLPADIDSHDDVVYEKAAENFRSFIDNGTLSFEAEPSVYVYQQKMGNHIQAGVVACCHIDDYANNLILKHEKTRQDKEDDRTRHVLTLNANTGPVFLTYKEDQAIDEIVNAVRRQKPLFDLTAEDGVSHTVWRLSEEKSLIRAFANIPVTYIADGHHRSAAAARAGAEKRNNNPNHNGSEEYNWFLSVLFPANQLKILPYNRSIHDLNGMTETEFFEAVQKRFTVKTDVLPEPAGSRRVSMYLGGKWYGLSWNEVLDADPVSALDVSYLQDNLLSPLLNIDDPRTSDRIDFIGGIRGIDALANIVDSGKGAVAFSMYPVNVNQMIAIADADCIMPPKSTWFEPKLRSGLLVHVLD